MSVETGQDSTYIMSGMESGFTHNILFEVACKWPRIFEIYMKIAENKRLDEDDRV